MVRGVPTESYGESKRLARPYGEGDGHFGPYGGRYVPETLVRALEELEEAYHTYLKDEDFLAEYRRLLREYAGRPTPVTFVPRLSEAYGAPIYLKREDLNHTGAHKINHALGQALLAERLGKRRLVAETGAGQHGVATATVAARFGMEAVIFMGEEDMRRQAPNVARMRLLGAQVVPVTTGTRTLQDAVSEAIRYWVEHVEDTYYLLGSAVGPHPYPSLVRDFQRVIGEEARAQFLEMTGELPRGIVASVGGGSNAIGLFYAFLDDPVEIVGVEAGGLGISTGKHAASLTAGEVGVLHGAKSYILQDELGNVLPAHSISAGLDYPGVGPEHAYLKEIGRVRYETVTDDEALEAFLDLTRLEGIIPALESAHAVAYAKRWAKEFPGPILINLSGRGDKDLGHVFELLEARGVKFVGDAGAQVDRG